MTLGSFMLADSDAQHSDANAIDIGSGVTETSHTLPWLA
jgi:hypothetical protein